MANDVSARNWNLDTASTAVPVWKDQVFIKWIKWNSPTNIGDDLIIQDINGKVIVQGKAETAAGSQVYNIENWFRGFLLHTLDSGTVTVHVK